MTVYVAAPNGRCHGSGENRTPLKLATKTTRLMAKGGGMMGSAIGDFGILLEHLSTRGATEAQWLHGCAPSGMISRSLPVGVSSPS